MSMFMQNYDKSTSKMYYRVRSSLIAALNECLGEIKDCNLSNDIVFFDFDCHADIHEMPQKDVLGLKGFSFYDDDGVINLSTFIVCSTMDDLNGIRLSKIIGHVFGRFIGNKAVCVLDEYKNKIAAITTVSGTEIMPMSKSDARMVQYIDVTAKISDTTR